MLADSYWFFIKILYEKTSYAFSHTISSSFFHSRQLLVSFPFLSISTIANKGYRMYCYITLHVLYCTVWVLLAADAQKYEYKECKKNFDVGTEKYTAQTFKYCCD